MSNTCYNALNISGDATDLKAFQSFARRGDKALEIDNFLPMPAVFRQFPPPNYDEQSASQLTDEHGHPDWHAWQVANWGTKWGAQYAVVHQPAAGTIQYLFHTAWTPFGERALRAMSEQFPKLRLHLAYDEPESGITGQMTAKGGRII